MIKTDHLKMLCDIGEINQLFSSTKDIASIPQTIVNMVAEHMHTAVCSIYFFDEQTQELYIKANKGLQQETITQVRLKKGEGLVGKALAELRPICLKEASKSPDFKFFPNLMEELYDSFLAVPICHGLQRIGVLVIQREKKYPFSEQDTAALKVIASQLATLVSQVMLFSSLGEQSEPTDKTILKKHKFLKGKIASSGFTIGKALVQRNEPFHIHIKKYLQNSAVFSINDFEKALSVTQKQLEKLQQRIEETLADVASLIFTAHLLMLKDLTFTNKIRSLINEGLNAPQAIISVGKEYMDLFASSENRLIQEKKQDIEDLLRRILANLFRETAHVKREELKDAVIIARELYPSDILKMSSEKVNGIILISGGVTSHVSILARSLHIPTIIIDKEDLLHLPDGITILIDGELGNVYIDPSDNTVEQFEKQKILHENILKNKDLLSSPNKTLDGKKIRLLSNINLLSDVASANESFTDGIGLYRTEFPFLIRNNFPSEEEQFFIYKKLVDGMKDKPITFRTLDIGGDKLLSYYTIREQNPFLGFRSIRFSLQHKDVFTQQIRAILRAGHNADIRIMFPMISSLDEFIDARNVLDDCLSQLKTEEIPHNAKPKIGIMIEIPSIIELLEDIADYVDFFSIGTNDLIQFLLAVDRTNEKVASFYNPLRPAVLRALNKIAAIAKKHKVEVSLCGDMAHEGKYIPFLIGIGITALSVDPIFIPKIKQTIAAIKTKEAEILAKKMIKKNSLTAITELLVSFYKERT